MFELLNNYSGKNLYFLIEWTIFKVNFHAA